MQAQSVRSATRQQQQRVTLTGVVFEELEVLRQVQSVGSSHGWNREQLGLTMP